MKIRNIFAARWLRYCWSVSPSAHARGPTGHRVVAEIAQRHLMPAARKRVYLLLVAGPRRCCELARRTLRSSFRQVQAASLRYRSGRCGQLPRLVKDPCGDVVVAIDAFIAFLRSGKRTDLIRSALRQERRHRQRRVQSEETDGMTPTGARFLCTSWEIYQPLTSAEPIWWQQSR
jgi:hypothetical protein